MDERRFARAGDSGDADEHVERDVDVDTAEVVDARAGQLDVLATKLAAVLGHGDRCAAGEVPAGDGVWVGRDFGDCPRGEELTTELACARAEIEQVVGGADDVGIVLDDEDGVAEVAELFHDVDESRGVASVETDGRLI